MKKYLLIFIFPLVLAACKITDPNTWPGYYYGQQKNPGAAQESYTATPHILNTPTAAYSPTPTTDWQSIASTANANAENAQATARAANIIVAQFTAQYNSEQAALQIAENERLEAQANAASISAAATATAYPISVPLTSTAFSVQSTQVHDKIVANQQAPTLVRALAESQSYADNADAIEKSQIGVRWSFTAFIMVMTIFLVMKLIALLLNSAKSAQPEDASETEAEKLGLIPLAPSIKDGAWTASRAQINCTTAEILEFADGIVNLDMTPGFTEWENKSGTSVKRPVLKTIRDFMLDGKNAKGEKFAELIRGSGGAIHILDAGIVFLKSCLETGAPPPPFKCSD